MSEPEPAIQSMEASEARQQWSQLLNKVFRRETRMIVKNGGIPVAAIISAEDLERFTQFEAERANRFKVLGRMRAPFRDTAPEEIEREVTHAIEEVRQEQREAQRANDPS
jgi:prevent-host-death family protein